MTCNCHNCRFIIPELAKLLERVISGEETVVIETKLHDQIEKTLNTLARRVAA